MPIDLLAHDHASASVRAAAQLASGGLLVVPTETVYGLLARGEAEAVARLRALQPPGLAQAAFTLNLAGSGAIYDWIGQQQPLLRRMARKAWPGPLTCSVVFPAHLPGPRLAALDPEVASCVAGRMHDPERLVLQLRCPQHAFTQGLIASAYASGSSPVLGLALGALKNLLITRADHAVEALRSAGVSDALVIDGGPTRYGKPSTVVRVEGRRVEVIRPGVLDERGVHRLLRLELLFVCSGNTCRSPMAALVAQHRVAERLGVSPIELNDLHIWIHSAGTGAAGGAPASDQAIAAMHARGLDLTEHRSRPLTLELINRADRIFCMTDGHRADIVRQSPQAASKIRLLADGPIADPYGGDPGDYEQAARQIEEAVARQVEELDL
mgnify:CR=1 FL=1